MNILFLDLSTKSSGWCVGDEYNKLIDYGCINSKNDNVVLRIIIMRDEILRIIQKYDIKKIVAEEVRPDTIPNNHTGKMLTWLQGVMVISVYDENPEIEFDFIAPSSWRAKIGISVGRGVKRSELKKADIDYVFKKYGIKENDDICDAIGIHDAYYIQQQYEKDFLI